MTFLFKQGELSNYWIRERESDWERTSAIQPHSPTLEQRESGNVFTKCKWKQRSVCTASWLKVFTIHSCLAARSMNVGSRIFILPAKKKKFSFSPKWIDSLSPWNSMNLIKSVSSFFLTFYGLMDLDGPRNGP